MFRERNEELEYLLSKLSEYRRKIGLTQTQLAELLGTTKTNLSLWETGRTTPTARKLFDILNVTGLHKTLFGYKPKRIRRGK